MRETVFVSIASSDYLHQANALFTSLLNCHVNASCFLLTVDEFNDKDRTLFPDTVSLLSLESLTGIDSEYFRSRYTLFELCNAIRPFLFEHIFQISNAPKIIYLDADILVLQDLSVAEKILDTYSFCCCPHILKPYPEDGQLPDDTTLLKFGVYNSGFMGFSNTDEGIKVLRYMQSRSLHFCFDNPPLTYVDQKILSIATSLYARSFKQIEDPGYNVAYWNVHERNLSMKENTLYTDTSPVTFFHFSGYHRDTPQKLTQWPYRSDSFNEPCKQQLLSRYQNMLTNRHP